MNHVIQRPGEQTNLWPVLSMHTGVSIETMLWEVTGRTDYRAANPRDLYHMVMMIGLRYGLCWMLEHIDRLISISLPIRALPMPEAGSGIVYTWCPFLGIYPDRKTLRSTFVEAFAGGMIFDPCFPGPIPASEYQYLLDMYGGKVVYIIPRVDQN